MTDQIRITRHNVILPCGLTFPYCAHLGRNGPTGKLAMKVPVFNDKGELTDTGFVTCVGHVGLKKRAAGYAAHAHKLKEWS